LNKKLKENSSKYYLSGDMYSALTFKCVQPLSNITVHR